MNDQIFAMTALFEQQLSVLKKKTCRTDYVNRSNISSLMTAPVLPISSKKIISLYEGVSCPVKGQREMLFLLAAQPDAGLAYTEYLAFALEGFTDVVTLERAWDFVARRHDALRVRAVTDEVVRISAAVPPWAVVDAVDVLSNDDELLRKEISTRIDHAHGPLARATLYRRRHDRHVLVIAVHHLVADGWSLGLVLAELAETYNALCRGVMPTLPEVHSLRDYAEWSARQSSRPQGILGGGLFAAPHA